MSPSPNAQHFIKALNKHRSAAQAKKNAAFFRDDVNKKNRFLGVRMKMIFDAAKAFEQMPLKEVEILLHDEHYEIRLGAVCIMDFKARQKKISQAERKELFDLYISRHRQIDNWDMVDRAAPSVVGGYLYDKPIKMLYKLAKSKNVWERRSAIVSTWFFIRQNDLEDTFKIAGMLLKDKHDLIQKAVGSWIREAGKRNLPLLLSFLDKHALIMPRPMLYNAVEKLDKRSREKYLSQKMIHPVTS